MYYSIKADVLERLFFLRTALFCVFSVFLFLASFPLACHALSLCLPCACSLPALSLLSACLIPALCLPYPCSLPATCLHINRTIGQRWCIFPFCAPCLSFRGITFFLFPCLPCACSLCALFLRMVGDGIARLVVNGRYRAMCCSEEGVG